ncbi:MAG: regulatory protein RecX [Clostridia bacterium]|nr:regulatory protein RecX [Clostridia bacterium]
MTAKDYALKLLSICDKTQKEVERKLREKSYSEEEIEQTLAFLQEYGYINDALYCRRYIADAKNLRHYGDRRIRADLAKRGAAQEIVDEVLSEYEDDAVDEIGKQITARFASVDFSDNKSRQRVFGHFLRKGFGAEEIRRAIARISDGEDMYFE